MSVVMPVPDAGVLARREEIVDALRAIVPGEGVIATEREMRPYESDGLTAYRQLPMVVVLPATTAQVSGVLAYCYAHDVKVVPRGAGTSLSGGALPLGDGVLLGMAKFNSIREVDFENRVAVVEPGVTNLAVTRAVEDRGFYYAPDPSSQIACTIGGNVAENSGGVHCLKYGMTTNNVLGLEMVLMTGEVIRLGGKHLDAGGYDLLGIVTGSEGLLGVVTEVTVRILQKAECARAMLIGFSTSEDAGGCVARIIGAGIIPGGMEMMDKPAIHAAEAFVHAGYPLDVEALLIIELDGPGVEVDELIGRVEAFRSARSLDSAGRDWRITSSTIARRQRRFALRCARATVTGSKNRCRHQPEARELLASRRGARSRAGSLESSSAISTSFGNQDLRKIRRLPSAEPLIPSMANSAQLVRRFGVPSGLPVRLSVLISQRLESPAISRRENKMRPSGAHQKL